MCVRGHGKKDASWSDNLRTMVTAWHRREKTIYQKIDFDWPKRTPIKNVVFVKYIVFIGQERKGKYFNMNSLCNITLECKYWIVSPWLLGIWWLYLLHKKCMVNIYSEDSALIATNNTLAGDITKQAARPEATYGPSSWRREAHSAHEWPVPNLAAQLRHAQM